MNGRERANCRELFSKRLTESRDSIDALVRPLTRGTLYTFMTAGVSNPVKLTLRTVQYLGLDHYGVVEESSNRCVILIEGRGRRDDRS